jgi:hypothetical protein
VLAQSALVPQDGLEKIVALELVVDVSTETVLPDSVSAILDGKGMSVIKRQLVMVLITALMRNMVFVSPLTSVCVMMDISAMIVLSYQPATMQTTALLKEYASIMTNANATLVIQDQLVNSFHVKFSSIAVGKAYVLSLMYAFVMLAGLVRIVVLLTAKLLMIVLGLEHVLRQGSVNAWEDILAKIVAQRQHVQSWTTAMTKEFAVFR